MTKKNKLIKSLVQEITTGDISSKQRTINSMLKTINCEYASPEVSEIEIIDTSFFNTKIGNNISECFMIIYAVYLNSDVEDE